MRAYYTDPLAAAWMLEKFGMKFDGYLYEDIIQLMAYGTQVNVDYLFNIHPDSMGILEPVAYDLIEGDGWYSHPRESDLRAVKKPFKIIQRNGMAFMWPEFEGE